MISNQILESNRISINETDARVTVEGEFSALVNIVNKMDEIEFNDEMNKIGFYHYLKEISSGFAGGTFKDLVENLNGNADLTMLKAAKEKLEKTGLKEKLMPIIQAVNPKRRRYNSEHDGDWSYDRRHEITPFSNTKRVYAAQVRTIDLQVHFAVSGDVDSESLDEYGALVWAISDILESAGLTTRITFTTSTNQSFLKRGKNLLMNFEIKRYGQYFSPSTIAGAFKTTFYRRLTWAFRHLMADTIDDGIQTGMGYQASPDKTIDFRDGKIIMSPMKLDDSNFDYLAKSIEQEVIRALNHKPREAVAA